MSNMHETLAMRMEIAMKAMMDRMSEMHREFEERMRRERSFMQEEIEAMIVSKFGSSALTHTEPTQSATATHKTMAFDIVAASTTIDIPATSAAKTTTLETPPDVISTLRLPTTTANTSLIKPSPQKLEQAIITTSRPEFAQESSTEQESSNEDLHVMHCLEPRMWGNEKNFRQKELEQRSFGKKATHKSQHIDSSAQSFRPVDQNAARNRHVLEEPRTEALKKEEAIKTLRRKMMVNLPDAHYESVDWYDVVFARLAQSIERMRLLTSGFGCSPRWALSKRKKHMPPYMHETIQALPMVC